MHCNAHISSDGNMIHEISLGNVAGTECSLFPFFHGLRLMVLARLLTMDVALYSLFELPKLIVKDTSMQMSLEPQQRILCINPLS